MSASLLSQLATAKNGLEDAHITLCGAVTAHAEAKRALELAEAFKLCRGVDGKNEAHRAAKLRLEPEAEYRALHKTEDALTGAPPRARLAAPLPDPLVLAPLPWCLGNTHLSGR